MSRARQVANFDPALLAADEVSGDKVHGGTISGSPTLVTPALGTPASGVVTNLSGVLPVGVTGGSGLDALSASNLSAGTIADARMPNLTGDVTTVEGAVATTIATDAVDIAMLSATGIAGSSTFLRGDNSWQTAGSTSASDLDSGTLAVARMAGGTVVNFDSYQYDLQGQSNPIAHNNTVDLSFTDLDITVAVTGSKMVIMHFSPMCTKDTQDRGNVHIMKSIAGATAIAANPFYGSFDKMAGHGIFQHNSAAPWSSHTAYHVDYHGQLAGVVLKYFVKISSDSEDNFYYGDNGQEQAFYGYVMEVV